MPEVSVVIPAYNAANTLAQTLSTVLGQTFDDFEVIVVDDGSNDGTAEIGGSTGDARCRVCSVPNGGVARARNRGVAEAQGELVAFLDADDLWRPTKLERQVQRMRSAPDAGMCFVGAMRVDADERPIGAIPARDFADYCEALLLNSVIIPGSCSSAVVRRSLALELGGFDPAFSQSADWDFWLRLSRITRFVPVYETLVLYRTHPGNMSSDIGLLERDSFAVLGKFFADPASRRYQPLRARVYSNHWMICSGSYLHARQIGACLRCLQRGLRVYPANITRPLGLPRRLLGRITAGSLGPR